METQEPRDGTISLRLCATRKIEFIEIMSALPQSGAILTKRERERETRETRVSRMEMRYARVCNRLDRTRASRTRRSLPPVTRAARFLNPNEINRARGSQRARTSLKVRGETASSRHGARIRNAAELSGVGIGAACKSPRKRARHRAFARCRARVYRATPDIYKRRINNNER